MTQYWDIFGTDDFHDQFSSPKDRLNDYRSYIETYPDPIYENQVNDTVITTDYDDTIVPVDKCSDGESSNDDDCGFFHIETRAKEAEDWLQSNFSSYSASSVIVIFDWYESNDTVQAGGWTPYPCGVNTQGEKVCIINERYGDFPSENTAAHEIGHVVCAEHSDVTYNNCSNSYKSGTYMHTTQDQDTCGSCDDDNVSGLDDYYSSCAKNAFQK